MKINWKEVAQSPGYKSLKQAVIDEHNRGAMFKRRGCSNYGHGNRYQEKFKFAISRATHYAYKRGVPLEVILNEWEEKRTYNFMNYYGDTNFPKLHLNALEPVGIRGVIKRTRKRHSFDNTHRKQYVCSAIMRHHKDMVKQSTRKPRWSNDRKYNCKRIRERQLQRNL